MHRNRSLLILTFTHHPYLPSLVHLPGNAYPQPPSEPRSAARTTFIRIQLAAEPDTAFASEARPGHEGHRR